MLLFKFKQNLSREYGDFVTLLKRPSTYYTVKSNCNLHDEDPKGLNGQRKYRWDLIIIS